MNEDKNKFIALYHFLNNPQDFNFEMNYYEFRDELKTLLDLYQKEKEKNKEGYKQLQIDTAEEVLQWKEKYYSLSRKLDVISKDKIKIKLEELKDKEQELTDEQGYWGDSALQDKIAILEELLEE